MLEDVLVKVNNLLFLVNLVILDMDEDDEIPLILGIHFLETRRYLIFMELSGLIFRFQDEKLTFNVFETMNENPQCYHVDIVEEMYSSESPLLSVEYIIVNSFKKIRMDNIRKSRNMCTSYQKVMFLVIYNQVS